MVVSPVGGIYAVGWVVREGDLHLQAPEYSRAIHCGTAYYGPHPGGGVEADIAGYQEVVINHGLLF